MKKVTEITRNKMCICGCVGKPWTFELKYIQVRLLEKIRNQWGIAKGHVGYNVLDKHLSGEGYIKLVLLLCYFLILKMKLVISDDLDDIVLLNTNYLPLTKPLQF